ncbi:Protein disulfide-isomerase TMX3 [Toxocara canis]|uniref:Protein disulfide-isomerase TMX3 n=1 Tax=Toxocara canis TaxID=6265 RepID=A0A0B2UTS5_TOXCA|nr:Protein disulfide-isomerase TMX3 [Toxocara canis]
MSPLRMLLFTVFTTHCITNSANATNVPSQVIELNDKFLQVKQEGMWFVEFYAPWCAHCKRLMPIWEHVGHALADRSSLVKVAKLDCTRYTTAASALNIRGYPTIIFFRNGQEMVYEGERKKEAMLDFAIKAAGPVVGVIESTAQISQLRHSTKEPFFVFVGWTDEMETLPLYIEYKSVADRLFFASSFHRVRGELLPQTVQLEHTPSVIVFKDDTFAIFNPERGGNLSDWIAAERWSLMPLITANNVKDVGATRLLVLSVINMIERRNMSTLVGRFNSMMMKAASTVRAEERLSSIYQFGWLDGNEMANSIVLGTVNQPEVLVFNVSSYEYYLSGDASTEVTEKSVVSFLERIVAGDVQPMGGRSISQRIKRIIYEVSTNVYEMFRAQPLLTVCLFGVPLAFLSLITYCICSTDFTVDRDEVFPDEEDDETDLSDREDHEKAD